jgi:hypothetical protein
MPDTVQLAETLQVRACWLAVRCGQQQRLHFPPTPLVSLSDTKRIEHTATRPWLHIYSRSRLLNLVAAAVLFLDLFHHCSTVRARTGAAPD